jgi:type II secretory pathway pseudopilin PulG
MVVALAIISIGVVGIAYGFSAVVRGAGDAQEQALLDGAAQTLEDYLQSIQVPYVPCASTYPILSPAEGGPRPPRGVTWSVTGVEIPVPNPPPTYASLGGGACPDYGVQGIEVTVSDGPSSVAGIAWKDDES